MKNNVFNILKKELRETFRDKKSLAMMTITPLLIPLFVIGYSLLFDMQANVPIEDYNKIGFNYETSEIENKIIKDVKIEPVYGNTSELKEKYDSGDINLYITKEENRYTLNGENTENTMRSYELAQSYLLMYKEVLQTEYLSYNNISANDVINIITIEGNITEEENIFTGLIISFAFTFILMAIAVASTYPATDTTAGEKERGTLETLLTFPIKNKDIIVGKFLSVSLSSIITGIISLILTLISLSISKNIFNSYKDIDFSFSAESFIFTIIIIIAYSLLISGICIAIASKSKTFKEAQSALAPITLITVFPGMIATLVNMKTTSLLSLIPFLNFSLLLTDIANNNANLLNILLMLFSSIFIITIILNLIIKQYKSDKILF